MSEDTASASKLSTYQLQGKRVWVAGHGGLVGKALIRRLAGEGCTLLSVERDEVDLRRQDQVEKWLIENSPQAIFVAAATVGGIHANDTRPADFIYDNTAIVTNIIHGAYLAGVEKLMALGSSCMYPRLADQPISEDSFMSGALEPTNEWYATAKIMGVRLCQAYRRQHGCDFISAVPTNLYGPGDNFDPDDSHVIAAVIRKVDKAKRENTLVEIWGTGKPVREFMYVDDAADALVFLMQNYSDEAFINIAGAEVVSILELTQIIAEILDFKGGLTFDTNRPDGMPEKRLDPAGMAAMGWRQSTSLREGLEKTCQWYLYD